MKSLYAFAVGMALASAWYRLRSGRRGLAVIDALLAAVGATLWWFA